MAKKEKKVKKTKKVKGTKKPKRRIKKRNLPKLKTRSFLNADWITNFWFFDNSVFFTDADLAFQNSILAKIEFLSLQANLNNRSDTDRFFLVHPNPVNSSILESSLTEIELVQQYHGYVYNINHINNQFYISVVLGNRGYVYVNDQVVYQDLVIVGKLENQIIAKRTIDRRTIVIDLEKNTSYQTLDEDIKAIVNLKKQEVYLNGRNEIICDGEVVYESDDDLTITQFSPTTVLVSERSSKTLFYLSGEHLENKHQLWKGNYFFHLICLDKKIIIGKPLYDNEGMINYGLPPIFIL